MAKRLLSGAWIVCLLVIVLAPLFFQPWLFLYGSGTRYYDVPVRPGTAVTIHFIHSVQKTPIWEYLVVNEQADGFRLNATKYQSFGVGLPFMLSDGAFHKEGDYFIMDHMDRNFPQLHLRTGVGTKLTVSVGEHLCPVYQLLPDGSAVDLEVAPLYRHFLNTVR